MFYIGQKLTLARDTNCTKPLNSDPELFVITVSVGICVGRVREVRHLMPMDRVLSPKI